MKPRAGRKLSWKPVRRGNVYCTPACGRKCTWQEYQIAKLKGQALADRLGPKWQPRVWENLGWHYDAESKDGRLAVSEYSRKRYAARITPGSFWEHATTPQAAVSKTIAAVRAKAAELLKLVEGL